ncbi:hypothetical protein BDA96_03G002200 [Sorghum bicolor]|uniref:Uncharacterized protein n=2 Tax=Sorghum bicolor TaxID=4558 RepID=A0A921RB07_SORBI|nr:hypothetical protein BDA96_03G002200 [Sorghum bicolor]OQU86046.1 hypothetical protein SORBI_3003G001751 [Sorghum bicolor]
MALSMLQMMSPQQQHQLEVLLVADLFGSCRFRKQYVTGIKFVPEAC